MKTATIPATSLREGQQRLKPNFYLNAGKLRLDQMRYNGHPMSTIGEQSAAVYRSDIFKRQFVRDPQFGLPYISGADITKAAPLESSRLVSAKYTPNTEETSLKTNQILVTCAGSVGNVRLITADLEGVIGSQDIIRVDYDAQKMPYGFLYAYLASPTAYDYMQSLYYGSVIPRIEPFHVRQIPVPRLPAAQIQQIHADIEQAARLREKATQLLTEAKQRIVDELKLNDLLSKPLSKHRVVRLSIITDSYTKRLEANAFAGFSGAMVQHFKSQEIVCRPLGEMSRKIFRPGIFKRIFVKNGIPFLGGGEMMDENPKPIKQLSRTQTDNQNVLMLDKYWTLITCGGTIGNNIFTNEGHIGMAASQHVIRVVAGEEVQSGFLYAYLASSVGSAFLKEYTYGSVIPQIEPHHIQNIPVPVLAAEIQEAIHEQVIQASDMQYQANQLEDNAIHTVETAISAWQK